ncbi:MAG: glycine cleavage system aminomethyltransferase GcvT [Alphaproteobacteria bacterium]
MSEPDTMQLERTPLYELHVRLGACMVPFAGYRMPLHYDTGILKEHQHTRASAGLFDVSHMGQIVLRPRSGQLRDAALALEALVPGDMLGLSPGRQRYTLFTNEAGGIEDDLMVSNQGDHFLLVVNAARKAADEAHLRAHLARECIVEALSERALIALQGPRAETVLAKLAPNVRTMRFMDTRKVALLGASSVVSRSGYTGEDGFEISIEAGAALALFEALLQDEAVTPIGLGARDSLRLEAGLCLYGSDIDDKTTPVEAALEWTIAKARRTGGARSAGFSGAAKVLTELSHNAARRRIGLRPEGRALVRAGSAIFRTESDAAPIGRVTSGGFGVSLGAPIAMGYVPAELATPGERLFAEVRGTRLPMLVSELPFVPTHYKLA